MSDERLPREWGDALSVTGDPKEAGRLLADSNGARAHAQAQRRAGFPE